MRNMPVIYVVSDSLGETAELVTKAALSQFNQLDHYIIKRFPFVEDLSNVDEVIYLTKQDQGMIVYTLVRPEIREYLKEAAQNAEIVAYDVISPLISHIQTLSGKQPLHEPGLMHKLDEEYFKKVDAIEFAVKYDDGRDPRGVLKADLVLIGVSRTSKTPLSQYLAHRRIKVANVPIVPEVDPPEELFSIDPEKCIGLKISPEKLIGIRTERLRSLGLSDNANYAKLDRIREELVFFEKVIERIGCPVIDVTNKAVEETANIIYSMVQKNIQKK